MELKEYWLILKRSKYLFGIIWAVVFLIGISSSFFIKSGYVSQLTLEVNKKKDNVGNEKFFDYDDYYLLEAEKSFSSVVRGWIDDPALTQKIQKEVFGKNKCENVANQKLKELDLKVGYSNANIISVTFFTENKQEAIEVGRVFKKELEKRVFKRGQDRADWFEFVFYPQVISSSNISFEFILIIPLLAGFLVALFGVFFWHFWSEP